MNDYKDLTGEDVLQAGDEVEIIKNEWSRITAYSLGQPVSNFPSCTFRRPLTTREIVAAERVRFEVDMAKHLTQRVSEPFLRSRYETRCYVWDMIEMCWTAYCAALSIDPMGDVE